MDSFSKKISIRWADLDPNFHLRHSVYYDFGSQFRVELLNQHGLTLKVMQNESIGPILFREECVFRREIVFGQDITITAKMSKMRSDASRWTIQHEFLNDENKLCALLTLDGAWMDTQKRKLASPIPQIVVDVFNKFPKAEDFTLLT
ncbi:thioesterase [Pedobacter sp. HMF7647]|uniref:Thioesterase n=1 Tax=Hufsiella arboris TaxID=2695275 RepID=A0A7K1YBS6_9SPHI|nr:thioesterase family protein [Hufsiella arboris]MXV52043.1 thioesterase [Hufsiella arboris]